MGDSTVVFIKMFIELPEGVTFLTSQFSAPTLAVVGFEPVEQKCKVI